MTDTKRPLAPHDSLPPVEPPSAAVLVQLFLVPGLIVAIIVCVWLAFHWLAHLGNDPQAYVRTLRRDNEGRWQAALNLANDLRGPGGSAFKADEPLATELGRILAQKVNVSVGPVTMLLPLGGISMISVPGQPFHDPAADDALFSAIRKWLSPAIPLVELDGAINDPAFAEACVERLMAC